MDNTIKAYGYKEEAFVEEPVEMLVWADGEYYEIKDFVNTIIDHEFKVFSLELNVWNYAEIENAISELRKESELLKSFDYLRDGDSVNLRRHGSMKLSLQFRLF